jgi:hypothetical protein
MTTTHALRLTVAAALLAPALALAQASVQLQLDLPVVLPQLVVVSPGVQVVPNVEEEVFYTSSWYWVRQDGGWYRSRSPRGGWAFVQPDRVPPGLVKIPPGQYRRWQPPPRRAPPPRPAPASWRGAAPAPAPVYRGGDDRGGHGHGGGGHGNGRGNGHGGHGRGHDRD